MSPVEREQFAREGGKAGSKARWAADYAAQSEKRKAKQERAAEFAGDFEKVLLLPMPEGPGGHALWLSSAPSAERSYYFPKCGCLSSESGLAH
jgi:hypothetical protein